MHKRACFVGAVASAALLAAGTPAFADSADNDGVNIGNDNNLSLLPMQLCDTSITGVGAVVSALSPQTNNCTNAPLIDHPQSSDGPGSPPEPPTQQQPPGNHEKPKPEQCHDACKPEHPKPEQCHDACKPEHPKPEQCHDGCKPEHPKPEHVKPQHPKPEHVKPEHPKPEHVKPAPEKPAPEAVAGAAPEQAELPAAPAPVSVPGHAAVTG